MTTFFLSDTSINVNNYAILDLTRHLKCDVINNKIQLREKMYCLDQCDELNGKKVQVGMSVVKAHRLGVGDNSLCISKLSPLKSEKWLINP